MSEEVVETVEEHAEEQSTALAVRNAERILPALKLDGTEFLQQYSPVSIQEKYNTVSTPLQASASDIPSLLDMEKTYGRDYVLGWLKLWLISLADFLDIKQPSDQQLSLSASTIYTKNKLLNLADLKVVTESILTGEVPLTAVRSDKVCPLLEKYWQRRCTENQEANDAKGKVITINTLAEDVLLQGYRDDLTKRVEGIEAKEQEAKRQADALRAKCKMADLIIKRNRERANNESNV